MLKAFRKPAEIQIKWMQSTNWRLHPHPYSMQIWHNINEPLVACHCNFLDGVGEWGGKSVNVSQRNVTLKKWQRSEYFCFSHVDIFLFAMEQWSCMQYFPHIHVYVAVRHYINIGRHILIFYFWSCASRSLSLKTAHPSVHSIVLYIIQYSWWRCGFQSAGKTKEEDEEDCLAQLARL